MPIGGIGGYGGVNPYDAYSDYFNSGSSGVDSAQMADGADFANDLDEMQNIAPPQQVEQPTEQIARVEPANESEGSGADSMRRDLSNVMEDMMDIQGLLRGFSIPREIPMAEGFSVPTV